MPTSVRFLFVALLAASGCSKQDAGTADQAAFPPTDVQTVTLAPKPIPDSSEFVATIRSLRSTTIQPQVEGIARQILVRAGDRVQAGQPLVQIDPDRQQATVAATESQRLAREADLAYAKQQLTRLQRLLDAGAVSKAELEQAEAAYKNAEAQLTAVQSQIRETQVDLQYYRVTAPTAGIVGDIPIRVGDRITPSTLITTIDQPQDLEAYVNVPLERSLQLRLGLPMELLDNGGAVIATNPLTFVASRADDATQSVLVKATLRQVPQGMRVMQYARARIVWNRDPALAVPVVAVSRMAGQQFVFIAEPAQGGFVARQKPVSLGNIVGDDYVVRGGVKAGDRVIVTNVQKIGDGAPVKPGDAAPSTGVGAAPAKTAG
jgi:RND family efflux transporter MFP subunit